MTTPCSYSRGRGLGGVARRARTRRGSPGRARSRPRSGRRAASSSARRSRARGGPPSAGPCRARPRARRATRSGSSRRRTGRPRLRGVYAPLALVAVLREVRRQRDVQALGVADVQAAGRVGAAEPLLARDGVEVVRAPRRRRSRRRTGRRPRASGRPVASASSSTGSRLPVCQDTCESAIRRVFGVTWARIASSACSGGRVRTAATRTVAPDAWSGPSSPKCSVSVVTISSSGRSRSPASTMLQPSVVEEVSATFSGRHARSSRQGRRAPAPRSASIVLEVRPARRGRARGRRAAGPPSPRPSRGRAGPNEPAFRYAISSRTGNCARASSKFTARARSGRGRTAACRLGSAARRARRAMRRRLRRRGRAMWSIPGPGSEKPSSTAVCRRSQLKSPAITTVSPGRARASRERDRAPQLGRGDARVSERARRVQVRDDEPARTGARPGRSAAPSPRRAA